MTIECEHCGRFCPTGTQHVCTVTGQSYEVRASGDFLISAAVAAVTDSALLGWFVGGSLIGGLLGDGVDGLDD